MNQLALLAPAILAIAAAVFVLIFTRRLGNQARRASAERAAEPPPPAVEPPLPH